MTNLQAKGMPAAGEVQHLLHHRAAPDPSFVTVESALVPGAIAQSQIPLTLYGGAYENGKLIDCSRLYRGSETGQLTACTEAFPTLPKPQQTLPEAVFGGYFFIHFGHFMLETMARLWWVVETNYQGPVVFQLMARRPHAYQLDMLRQMGIDPILLSPNDCVQLTRLTVPSAALHERHSAHPKWALPLRDLQSRIDTSPETSLGARLFVSRGTDASPVHGEIQVQQALEAQGYQTLDPTRTTIAAQIAAFENARFIVGLTGSAMHNLVYAKAAQKVAIISREASVNVNFPNLDRCLNSYESTYIYPEVTSPLPNPLGSHGAFLVDAKSTCNALFEAGFLDAAPKLDPQGLVAARDAYMSDFTALNGHLFPKDVPPTLQQRIRRRLRALLRT